MARETGIQAAERIYNAWDEALGKKNVDDALSLYAEDATLESPLIRYLLGIDEGVIRGRANLRSFVELIFRRSPAARQRYRTGFFTDGLAGDRAANVVEALANFAHGKPSVRSHRRIVPGELSFARCCYTHLAGTLGVNLAALLVRRGYVHVAGDHAELTEAGRHWAADNHFLAGRKSTRRPDLRLCLDWTERRHHLAGQVPSAILRYLLDCGHLQRGAERSLKLSASGNAWFAALDRPERYQSET